MVHNVRVTVDDAPAQVGQKPGRTESGRRAQRTPAEGRGRQVKPKRSGLRRVTFWTGVGLLLAGLGLLGYVAWQLWGTNWVSKRYQREITSELQEDWAAGQGKTPQFVPEGDASALIRIPKFGRKYVVPVIEGTTQEIFARGYGHFKDSAFPGQVGNYALAAHRVTHGEPLRDLPKLRPGDKVIVETVDFTYTYVLDTNPNDLVIPFTGTWVLDPIPDNPDPNGVEPAQAKGQALITLTTCSEIFRTDNRMIAFGHLVAAKKKGPAAPVNP